MSSMKQRKQTDPAVVKDIEATLMDWPGHRPSGSSSVTMTDGPDALAQGMLQAAVNAGLQAEMNAHQGLRAQGQGREKQSFRPPISVSGSYMKKVGSNFGVLIVSSTFAIVMGRLVSLMVPKSFTTT